VFDFSGTVEMQLRTYGETISYTPQGGATRDIMAIVRRHMPQDVSAMPGQAPARRVEIVVANRETAIDDDGIGGISLAGLDTGRDTVTLADRAGGAPEARRPARILVQTDTYLRLEVI